MQDFIFENPTKIIFEKKSVPKVGVEVRRYGTKALLVYGQGSIRRTAARKSIARLKTWFHSIGSPVSLVEGEMPGEDMDRISDNVAALASLWKLQDYGRDVTAAILDRCR